MLLSCPPLSPALRALGLAAALLPLLAPAARASKPKRAAAPLGCNVEGLRTPGGAARLCEALATELSRPTLPVADARGVEHGEAVHIFDNDVVLIVALFRDGKVAGFTRVSKDAKVKDYPHLIALALRELMTHAPQKAEDANCIHLKHRHHVGRDEIAYPWAQFHHCDTHMLELVRPWM